MRRNAQLAWYFWWVKTCQNQKKTAAAANQNDQSYTNCVGVPQIIYWSRGPLEWAIVAKKVNMKKSCKPYAQRSLWHGFEHGGSFKNTEGSHERSHKRSGAFAQKGSDNPPAKQWRPQVFPQLVWFWCVLLTWEILGKLWNAWKYSTAIIFYSFVYCILLYYVAH